MRSDLPKVRHAVPMLSIRTETDAGPTGARAFDARIRRELGLTDADPLLEYSAELKLVVQWASSPYFVRAISASGSVDGSEACVVLAVPLQAKMGGDAARLPASLAMVQARPGAVKIMRGRLGLENGFDHWSALFEGFEQFELYVLPVGAGGGRAVVAEARFAATADAARFSARFMQKPGTPRHLWQRDDGRVILLEAATGADSLRGILEGCPVRGSA